MAVVSRCPNPECETQNFGVSARFEIAVQPPILGVSNRIELVRCSSCGTVVSGYDIRHFIRNVERGAKE